MVGVTLDNVADLNAAGVDIAVAGSAVFDQKDYQSAIQGLKK